MFVSGSKFGPMAIISLLPFFEDSGDVGADGEDGVLLAGEGFAFDVRVNSNATLRPIVTNRSSKLNRSILCEIV